MVVRAGLLRADRDACAQRQRRQLELQRRHYRVQRAKPNSLGVSLNIAHPLSICHCLALFFLYAFSKSQRNCVAVRQRDTFEFALIHGLAHNHQEQHSIADKQPDTLEHA